MYTCLCWLLSIAVVTATINDRTLNQRGETQVQHVREWTEWFNTDSPTQGTGDDESLASIRKRGFSICAEDTPVDAVCRLADDATVVFNVGTTDLTDDVLVIPCTSVGIVCRNKDQGVNRTCQDYGIRFQCLTVSGKNEPMENLGLIGIAAGLSVIVPILCVTCMHLTRMLKERNLRNHRSHDEEESTDSARSSVSGDLPPSYSALFGEGSGSTEQLISDTSSHLVNPVIDASGDYSVRRSSTVSIVAELGGSGTINTVPNSRRLSRSLSLNSISAQVDRLSQTHGQGRRFPGMHLSIIDLIIGSEESCSNIEDSSDQSYIQTPPPTYKEAVLIIGGVPYTYADVESCLCLSNSEKVDTDEQENHVVSPQAIM